MSGVLAAMQQELADRLMAEPSFADVPVLTERLHDLESQVERALNRIGLMAVVTTPLANIGHQDTTTPYFDDVHALIRIYENVMVNKTRHDVTYRSCLEMAEITVATVHHFKPDGINEVWVPENPTITLGNDPMDLCYDCRFTTQAGIIHTIPQIALPTVTAADLGDGTASVTVACATTGAAVFYTTDGTYPAPRKLDGTAGSLYSAPFIVADGAVVKVRAWLAGYLASDLVSATVTL